MIRIIEVQAKTAVSADVLQRAEEVPFDLLLDIRNGSHPFYKTYSALPVNGIYFSVFATDSQNSGKPRIEFSQTLAAHATDACKLLYIKKPTETRTSECSLPDSLETLVVDYASAQCLIQMGQTEEGLALIQRYDANIKAINDRYANEVKSTSASFERPK